MRFGYFVITDAVQYMFNSDFLGKVLLTKERFSAMIGLWKN